jgi:hypothetical protein
MSIPYYPYTSCKDASFELGIALKEFMGIVDRGLVEVSDRGGKTLVNNDTLQKYIRDYGGRRERYREELYRKLHTKQRRIIKQLSELISPEFNGEVSINKYTHEQIEQFNKTIKDFQKQEKELKKLLSYGLTYEMLEKYYEDESFDYTLPKNKEKEIWLREKTANRTFNTKSFSEFFRSYKPLLASYRQIKFLPLSEIRPIVLELRKKFGY